MSANAFRTVVDIDLNGTFNVFRGCHDLLNTPGASLIAITAGQAVNASALQAHACAAKAGINQLIRVLALEWGPDVRSEEHTSELQSLMRTSYAVFCLTKKTTNKK